MIKVLFFGAVANKLGKCSADAQGGLPLAELIVQFQCEDIQPLLVAVNQEQTHDMDYIVKDGDEVALMPPFSGG